MPSRSAALAVLNASIESHLPRSGCPAGGGHVLRNEPYNLLAACDQEPLERAGECRQSRSPIPAPDRARAPAQQLGEASLRPPLLPWTGKG